MLKITKAVMNRHHIEFNDLVEAIYNLPLEDRVELKSLLKHNIAESRRDEIASNFKEAQQEYKLGNLEFSSNIEQLKKML